MPKTLWEVLVIAVELMMLYALVTVVGLLHLGGFDNFAVISTVIIAYNKLLRKH
jgi:hypothetical protein